MTSRSNILTIVFEWCDWNHDTAKEDSSKNFPINQIFILLCHSLARPLWERFHRWNCREHQPYVLPTVAYIVLEGVFLFLFLFFLTKNIKIFTIGLSWPLQIPQAIKFFLLHLLRNQTVAWPFPNYYHQKGDCEQELLTFSHPLLSFISLIFFSFCIFLGFAWEKLAA